MHDEDVPAESWPFSAIRNPGKFGNSLELHFLPINTVDEEIRQAETELGHLYLWCRGDCTEM